MKKIFTILCAMVALHFGAMAQGNPNADAIRQSQAYCPGLFNPSQFSVVGSNPASASWQGKAGGNMSGGGGKAGNSISTCGNWDMTFPTSVTAQQIDAATPNSGSVVYNGNYGGNSSNICSGTQTEDFRRFKVMNAGWDSRTGGNGYLYTVPTDPDTTFMRSIRLGNHCGGGREADQLIYQFKVLPQNALLVLYYAVSLDDAFHLAQQNPEFVIEVQTGTATGSTVISNLNTYTYSPVGNKLFFSQSSPESSSQLGDFTAGANGTHNCFLQWNKVVINLGAYLTNPVRILIGSCDCSMSQHYGYAYIAGYCRPMKIQVDGCPIGTTSAVSTLVAPSGLEDASYTADPNYHAYQWYICNNPEISAENIPMSYADSTDWFARNFTIIPGANSNTFETQVSHFFVGGDTVSSRAFACVMTTFMNKSVGSNGHRTYPIVSRLFADATNQKPQVSFEPYAYCDGTVELRNRSFCGVPGFMVDSLTTWSLYPNQACLGAPLQSMTGSDGMIHTTQAGTYYVKMHVPTDSASCYSEAVQVVTSIENPHPSIYCSNTEPCLGQEIVLRDETEYVSPTGNSLTWSFSDSTTSNQSTVNRDFTQLSDTVRLHVENGYTEPIGNTTQTRHCEADTFIVIKVFNSPELAVSADTIVCEGQRTHVTVSVVDDDPTATYEYEWARRIGGTPIQTGNVLEQVPDAVSPTSKYYVKVTRMPQGCEAWDSVTVHVVRPTLTMLPADGKICPGEQVKLIGAQAHHYSWTASTADESLVGQEEKDTIIVSPARTTTYTLIGHGSDDCNADPLTSTVTVYPTPIQSYTFNPDFVDSEDPVVTFRDVSQYGETSRWDFGGGESATGRQVSHTFSDMSADSVHVTLTSYNALGSRAAGCYTDTSFALPIQLFSVWMPNMFTPNLENNRTFRMITANDLENFHIYIYDRRGQLILESADQNFEWDGTFKGIECPQASYVYIFTYRRPGTSVVETRKGTVTLIR
ncbi:MAG: gliding motility-associated C-terminal domain-containing protein [Bacteroidales bacterium]|nr:gliding motility-associated C-terminal domain-containing protein [Bacteroidales bacterium]